MKKYLFLVPLITILFLSCSDTETNCPRESYCNCQDPLNDLPWLKDMVKDKPANLYIYTSTYNGSEGISIVEVFDTNNMSSLVSYRTCDNTILYKAGGIIGSSFPKDFERKNTFRKMVYPK